MFFFFYFNLIFGYKLVILIYFYFVHSEIKLTYLLKYNISPNNRKEKNYEKWWLIQIYK